jgi:hypothetical protein
MTHGRHIIACPLLMKSEEARARKEVFGHCLALLPQKMTCRLVKSEQQKTVSDR